MSMGRPELEFPSLDSPTGLYDPRFEKGSCGIGLVVQTKGIKSHSIVSDGIEILKNLEHRGAVGADGRTGDGCGILTQIPERFFLSENLPFTLPLSQQFGIGMFFLPKSSATQSEAIQITEAIVEEENIRILGWRDVPINPNVLGNSAKQTQPVIRQLFVAPKTSIDFFNNEDFERKLYVIRRRIELLIGFPEFAIPSFSSRTIVYKGLLSPKQLCEFYLDLNNSRFESAIALVHSRFSTNTFPQWKLAHPYRLICHNGEINTLRGNLNWMKARQSQMTSSTFKMDLQKIFPLIDEKQSDSACLDNTLEFLVRSGKSLPQALMTLIPEAWNENSQMNQRVRDFYEYHSQTIEPWDGPAAVCFSDGELAGATLDRNGLRPCRYLITRDDRLILASEAGVLDLDPSQIISKSRLEPGQMLLIDTRRGQIFNNSEIKSLVASQKPYGEHLKHRIKLDEISGTEFKVKPPENLETHQKNFGYTEEEINMVLLPMALNAEEPLSSMGSDTPLSVLSERPKLLFSYFKQLFAQVTNPPIDPIREQLVMSLMMPLGKRTDLLDEKEPPHTLIVKQPFLAQSEIQKIKSLNHENLVIKELKTSFQSLEQVSKALQDLCEKAKEAVRGGASLLVISDRDIQGYALPILLAVSAIHQSLLKAGLRTQASLIVETAEARDVHHFACLFGFGAEAIYPYLALDTLSGLFHSQRLPEGVSLELAQTKYLKAAQKGLLKILSKMGISTLQSYCGAQIFEALGIHSDVIDEFFTGTSSRIQGVGLSEIAQEVILRYQSPGIDRGSDILYRPNGENHIWIPKNITTLQKAGRENSADAYRDYAANLNEEAKKHFTIRGLLDFCDSETPIPLSEVEPASQIVRRFNTGAMSLGAISEEAHQTLAVAMNRMGGKSNSGEGGEDPERFRPKPNGDSANSAIKQIASARFGVTINYLVSAKELQIKMAQGAKPGEGGQLPGHKVDDHIAYLRHSTPGVGLISPPPHHDIYSIEDLKQLIFDLKNANESAQVSVKLVSEVGVGTIAAGVAKAKADKILISGDSGGTGASPLSSIKNAGLPWELGLAETHQVLTLNGLRSRVKLETDGQLKTGRDVAIAALLGAQEFGFATAPLIVTGCVMMRKCHLNTCPVGIATQDPELRKRFKGRPEHVINYFFLVAEELRQIMSRMGFRNVEEMIGRVDKLKQLPSTHWKAHSLNFDKILTRVSEKKSGTPSKRQNHDLEEILDRQLVEIVRQARDRKVRAGFKINNSHRTVGTHLSSYLARQNPMGLEDNTLQFDFEGSAGQSFGAFLINGVTLKLTGEANDYVGKGLSGGRIIISPPLNSGFDTKKSIIVGNTCLYGATSGDVFFAGMAGERFGVRNSGATAVVEGVGDHGCEYMTGGTVVILGSTGRNFAAGMSGGLAYVLDLDSSFEEKCNLDMVELHRVLSPLDEKNLKKLIVLHYQHTKSAKVEVLLKNWKTISRSFVKVIPSDYKKVLEAKDMRSTLINFNRPMTGQERIVKI